MILTRSRGLIAKFNLLSQSLFRRNRSGYPKIAGYTHVLLCAAPFIVIDATTEHGVKFHDLVDEIYDPGIGSNKRKSTIPYTDPKRFKVIRSKRFVQMHREDVLDREQWLESAKKALDRGRDPKRLSSMFSQAAPAIDAKYAWGTLFENVVNRMKLSAGSAILFKVKERDEAFFCSQLVAELLQRVMPIGKNILPKTWTPSETYPVDFEALVGAGDWEDVTDVWLACLQRLHHQYFNDEIDEYEIAFAKIYMRMARDCRALFELNREADQFAKSVHKINEDLRKIQAIFRQL